MNLNYLFTAHIAPLLTAEVAREYQAQTDKWCFVLDTIVDPALGELDLSDTGTKTLIEMAERRLEAIAEPAPAPKSSTPSAMSFSMTVAQAQLIHELAASEIAAHKNWIVSRVESGDFDGAKALTRKLRELQNIFAAFNVEAKVFIAEATGKDFPSSVEVRGS